MHFGSEERQNNKIFSMIVVTHQIDTSSDDVDIT